MSLSEFIKEFNDDKTEGYLLKSLFFSLISGFLILFLLYFLFIRGMDFDYIFYSILLVISYSILMPSLLQVRSYQKLPCMSGMMVGMTFGMVAGFLPGFYIASVSGMFYGSVFGMFIGILFGYLNGKCCGIMGIMEGVMAGFMGGLMGAMTSIMLLNDHVRYMAVIVLIISSVIMFGLSYMIYHENKNVKKIAQINYKSVVLWSVLLALVSVLFMLFGPKGGIFA